VYVCVCMCMCERERECVCVCIITCFVAFFILTRNCAGFSCVTFLPLKSCFKYCMNVRKNIMKCLALRILPVYVCVCVCVCVCVYGVCVCERERERV